jgi:PelA/Pel-15E family pectate lyase
VNARAVFVDTLTVVAVTALLVSAPIEPARAQTLPVYPRQAEGAWRAIKEGAREPAWYASVEARGIAEAVLLYQTPEGGWPKNVDMTHPPSAEWRAETTPDLRAATIDNGATTSQIVFLARVNAAQDGAPLREACVRGLDYLLAAQYPNGGWPQFFPLRPGYYTHITFNDDAMVLVLELLRDVAEGAGPYAWVDAVRRGRARQAVERGIDCVLRCQIEVGGRRTAWCAQHDERTFAPAPARTFEPVSLSGDESVGVVRFLMSRPDPSPAVIAAIEDAVAWFEAARLTGIWYGTIEAPELPGGRDRIARPDPAAPPLWAREYEIGTNRPIFCGRDAIVRYSVAEIEHERRVGYRWYTEAPRALLTQDYPAWATRHGRPARRPAAPR